MKGLGLLVCLLVVCSAQPPDYPALKAELDANRALWESRGILAYRADVTRQCFCLVESLGPFEIFVVDREIVSVDPDNQFAEGLPTIEDLFDQVEDAISREIAAVTVSYDAEYGFITDVFLDEDFFIADEEIGFIVSNFVPEEVRPPSGSPSVPRIFDCPLRGFPLSPNGFNCFLHQINQRAWNNFSPRDYTYKFERQCFCFGGFRGPFIITVVDREVVSATFEDGTPVLDLSGLPTIDGLFDLIREEAEDAYEVSVTYDPLSRYPTRASIDRIKDAVDDEITYVAQLL